jgi:hypothetical protein
MAVLLEATSNFLQDRLVQEGVTQQPNLHVGIEPEGFPPGVAPKWYICIDELSTERIAANPEYQLEEEYSIAVWCCRQAGEFSGDRRGQMLVRTDIYRTNLETLETLERQVLRYIHLRDELRIAANILGGFGQSGGGDIYQTTFQYTGRGKSLEVVQREDSNMLWNRRQLTFRGMKRIQGLDDVR